MQNQRAGAGIHVRADGRSTGTMSPNLGGGRESDGDSSWIGSDPTVAPPLATKPPVVDMAHPPVSGLDLGGSFRLLLNSDVRVHRVRASALSLVSCDFRPGSSLKIVVGAQPLFLVYFCYCGQVNLSDGKEPVCIPGQALELRPLQRNMVIEARSRSQGYFILFTSRSLQHQGALMKRRVPGFALSRRSFEIAGSDESFAPRLLADCLVRGCGQTRSADALKLQRLCDLLLTLVLVTLIETAGAVPGSENQLPRYVTFVEELIRNGPSHHFSICELARLAGVSSRTLHEGFRKSRGYSPIKFQREQRMLLIKEELSHPDAHTTVTDVALKWGVNHLGRFPSYYYEQFGERPSETLHLAKSRGKSAGLAANARVPRTGEPSPVSA